MNLKKLIGSFIFVFFYSNFVYSQCPGIRELIGIYDNETSYLSDLNFSYEERLQEISYKGTTFKNMNLSSYFGSDYSNKIRSDFNGFLEFNTQNNSCFLNIKAQVAKEVGNKVSPKQVSEINGWYIESYEHLSKNIFIQFHKSSEYNGYKIVILSNEKIEYFQNQIYRIEQQKEVDNRVSEIISQATIFLKAKKYEQARNEISRATQIISEEAVSEEVNKAVFSFIDELESIRFNDFHSEIYKLISANQYVKARIKLKELKNDDHSNADKILKIQTELNNKAVSFYSKEYLKMKDEKLFKKSISYSDSVLIFSPNDKNALNNKSELFSILELLEERKIKTYDYWQFDYSLKSRLLSEYNEKCFSVVSNKLNGNISFELSISTDTNCIVKGNINWGSTKDNTITFGEPEINNFSILPYEKYGYCLNSKASISYNLKWNTNNYQFKFVDGEIKSKYKFDSRASAYIQKNYPKIKGKVFFSKKDILLNNEQSSILYINSFKTRGPENAIFSFILPGLGTYRVTYGQKGLGILLCFTGSVAAVVYGKPNSSISRVGTVGILTSYIWDFSSTLIKGSKNLINSKELRKKLKNDPIKI
jgi:hypothetical protein